MFYFEVKVTMYHSEYIKIGENITSFQSTFFLRKLLDMDFDRGFLDNVFNMVFRLSFLGTGF